MCLGIPGRIVEISSDEHGLAIVDVGGVRRTINIACIVDDRHPAETCVGEWVLVHVGFAMSRIDPEEARRTIELLTQLGEMQAEIQAMPASALYPFLNEQAPAPARLDQELLESVRRKAEHSLAVKRAFFAEHGERVVAAAKAIATVYRRGGRLFAMGNGGSSCDAAHIAVEFLHPVTAGRPALPAVNLDADVAMLTAVGNDVGFEHVFVRQVIAQARAGDGLIGVSTSGNSPNLMRAFETARGLGVTTIALSGGDGGVVARSPAVDHCLVVETDSIHRAQECHVAIYHILWDLVHTLLANERGRAERKDGP
jgi:D-sedoheptulose 7-phosphate isomerase